MKIPNPVNFEAIEEADGLAFGVQPSGEIVEFSPRSDYHLMVSGIAGSGKTVISQTILYGAVTKGFDVYTIVPSAQWRQSDFSFFDPYAKAAATTPPEAIVLLRSVDKEVQRRIDVMNEHGVASIYDLPEGVRPSPIFLLFDDFASFIPNQFRPQKEPFDDPKLEADRQEQITEMNDLLNIGSSVTKLSRYSRSAGVSLMLISQVFRTHLDIIPGGAEIRTNMSRILVGYSRLPERMSGLRNFETAPLVQSDMPRGSAIFESFNNNGVLMQGWYASPEEFAAELAKRVTPLTDDQKIDLSPVAVG